MQSTQPQFQQKKNGRAPGTGSLVPSSRRGTLALAGVTILLAAAALLVFLHQYRDSLTDTTPVDVLVAKAVIPKGTPGSALASSRLYHVSHIRKSRLDDGAITDPKKLEGKVAASDIYPGHQLTSSDFKKSDKPALDGVSGYYRAMTVPVDAAHGLIGEARPGDRVDVLATYDRAKGGQGGVRTLSRNALILDIPSKIDHGVGSKQDQSATVRVPDRQAAQIAYAVDNGKVWLVLRPKVGARDSSGGGL